MKIAIVGVGLLGGSTALGIRSVEDGHVFIGVDTNEEHITTALKLGIIDETKHFKQALKEADLTILATPVNVVLKQLPEALDLIKDSAILMDVGSTKSAFSKIIRNHPKRKQYVSCHPIAGTENSGPAEAFAALLKNKQMIICDREKSDAKALERVLSIIKKLNMRISFMKSEDHDRHIAYVSHLSHISSFALGLTVLNKEKDERSIFEMAGSGFSSTVRLAKSSPDMWAPIFKQNAKNISVALQAYINQLQQFKEIIDCEAEEKSHELMQQANDIRRILLGIEKT